MRTSTNFSNFSRAGTWQRPMAIVGLCFGLSSVAQADPPWFDNGYYAGGAPYGYPERYCPERRSAVVVEQYYYPAQRAYYAPPPIVYQPPPQVVYQAPAPVYYYQEPQYSQAYAPTGNYGYGGGYGRNRILSSAVLGAAGGLLGSQVGHGSGRAAATAAGAVAGWVLGSQGGW